MKRWIAAMLIAGGTASACLGQNPRPLIPPQAIEAKTSPAEELPTSEPTTEKPALPPAQETKGSVTTTDVPQTWASGNGRPARRSIWGGAEYLLWSVRDMPVSVPLLTQGNLANLGVLGAPGTQVALGNQGMDFGLQHGGRFTVGLWMNAERTWGIESNFFYLGENSASQTAVPNAGGFLAVPFNNVNGATFVPLGNVALPLTFPGIVDGSASLTARTRMLGAELNVLFNRQDNCGRRVDWFGGFRYLNLDEDLTFEARNTIPAVPGDFATARDGFNTRNNFYGGQIGARISRSRGRLFGDVTGKVALGVMNQELAISGETSTNRLPGGVQSIPGGIFAQPTNMGTTSRDRFAIVPELTAKVGYRLTRNLSAYVGYTFLYVNDVARPGDQIDTSINTGQAPGLNGLVQPGLQGFPARPERVFNSTDFWAHGVNFGLAFRW